MYSRLLIKEQASAEVAMTVAQLAAQ